MILEPVISVIQNICLVFGILLRTLPLQGVSSKNQKTILIVLYMILLTGNAFFLTWMFFEKGTSTAFIKYNCLIIGIIASILNYIVIRKRGKEHIFISGITMLCEYLILTIPAYLIPRLMPLDNIYAHTAFVLMYGVMLALAYTPLKFMLDKTVAPFLQIDKTKYWNILWFIPAILCISMYMMFPYEENIQTVAELLSRVLMGIVLIIICFSVSGERKSLLEKQVMSEQMSNAKVYYASLQSRIEESRKLRHDLKHLLVSIRHYIETDDKKGLENFCNDVEKEQLMKDAIPYTGNAAVDGLLFHYIRKAATLDINFEYIGKINVDGIIDMDLCVLLGNALDNAFTACQTIDKDRKVTMVAQVEAETISFVIKNTFDGVVKTNDKMILSRKRENSEGIGLKSMEAICEKYKGTMRVEWDEVNFVVLIILTIDQDNAK